LQRNEFAIERGKLFASLCEAFISFTTTMIPIRAMQARCRVSSSSSDLPIDGLTRLKNRKQAVKRFLAWRKRQKDSP
jgi:hypothetical protein